MEIVISFLINLFVLFLVLSVVAIGILGAAMAIRALIRALTQN